MERVPAGTEFGPLEIALFVYEGDAVASGLDWLVDGLELVEADGLGSSVARGSGRVEFRDIAFRALVMSGGQLERRQLGASYPGTTQLREQLDQVKSWARS